MSDKSKSHAHGKKPANASLLDRVARAAETSPLALVAGGLTAGLALGALLPRSESERRLLAPIGARIGESVAAAVDAAKEAGQAELADAGISRDAARDQVRNLVDGLLKAASSAGSAAAQAAAGKTVGHSA